MCKLSSKLSKMKIILISYLSDIFTKSTIDLKILLVASTTASKEHYVDLLFSLIWLWISPQIGNQTFCNRLNEVYDVNVYSTACYSRIPGMVSRVIELLSPNDASFLHRRQNITFSGCTILIIQNGIRLSNAPCICIYMSAHVCVLCVCIVYNYNS